MSELAQKVIEENKRTRNATLDLGNCGMTELPDLSGMDWVETLIVSNKWWDQGQENWMESQNIGPKNKIARPPAHPLPLSLKKVILGSYLNENWPIHDFGFLRKLTSLNTLDLSFTQINDWRFLKNLTNLTSLNLSYSKIVSSRSNINVINEILIVGGNAIIDGRFFESLTNLRSLNLSGNLILDFGVFEKLTGLTSLNLSNNQISDVPLLERLTSLNTLDFSNNQISDGWFLEKLTGLTSLNLSGNQISDGQFLEKLTGLTSLDLSYNQVNKVVFLKHLVNLQTLLINDNQITEITKEIYFFLLKNFNIEYFYFSINERKINSVKRQNYEVAANLRDIESVLMKCLEVYSIEKIEKPDIPLPFYNKFLSILITNNPLQSPPIEVVNKGNEAILDYFHQKEKTGAKLLLEAKMVLLGDGRAGKTSLACRMLRKELPRQEDRTQGVDIVIGEYRFPVEEGEFVLHIWDFAGQDKYKPLHQFFYTEGAVYVMVADSGNAQTDFADWFETTEMFGGEGSPLLVALNEFREDMGMGTFDEEKWRRQFPKLIKEVHLVNLLSQRGFPELEKDIRHLANQLPHTHTEYPANWANIRAELERRRDENYISLQEYLNICRQFDLPERESALILSAILHKIGVCLHYQKNTLLRQHVILKNEWATAAVYKILEDRTVVEVNKGFFDWSDLSRVWSDDSYQDMQPQLLALMCEFKMAYPLPNGREYVTPPLLPTAPPSDWDFPADDALEVRVEYEFLPKALMTQFIVSRHTDIDRGRTLVWREGVVLRWSNDTLAQVSKIKSRGRDAFQIRALGGERRGLLTAILKTLRDLHDEYRGIRAHEVVPCPCGGCRSGKNPQHYFEFKNLSNRLEKGRRSVECDQSLEEVDLLKILGDLLVFERLGIGEALVLKDVDRKKPVEQQPRDIKIFLASSAELREDRDAFDLYFRQLNDSLRSEKGIYLRIVRWENFLDAMSDTRIQDEYNDEVRACDIFVSLFFTKTGKFTEEEFDVAHRQFLESGGRQPQIFTFFKNGEIKMGNLSNEVKTLLDFKEKLGKLGHFYTSYDDIADLKLRFRDQLDKLLEVNKI